MKKTKITQKLKLSQQTIRDLQTDELKQVAGGTIIGSWGCTAVGCAGTNNSCRICYEN